MSAYRDRIHAGQVLAGELRQFAGRSDAIVLGLPRGGVPVAAEVARLLSAPLDVFVVRKLGAPGQEELAMGAIASGGITVLNEEVSRNFPNSAIEEVTRREQRELLRREQLYRGQRGPLEVERKIVILVDDGLATGATMRAAAAALRQRRPARIVVAAPVGAAMACQMLAREVDELICPLQPESFLAVSTWYDRFEQTSDQEVHTLLENIPAEPASERKS